MVSHLLLLHPVALFIEFKAYSTEGNQIDTVSQDKTAWGSHRHHWGAYCYHSDK